MILQRLSDDEFLVSLERDHARRRTGGIANILMGLCMAGFSVYMIWDRLFRDATRMLKDADTVAFSRFDIGFYFGVMSCFFLAWGGWFVVLGLWMVFIPDRKAELLLKFADRCRELEKAQRVH